MYKLIYSVLVYSILVERQHYLSIVLNYIYKRGKYVLSLLFLYEIILLY